MDAPWLEKVGRSSVRASSSSSESGLMSGSNQSLYAILYLYKQFILADLSSNPGEPISEKTLHHLGDKKYNTKKDEAG
jgi:hypothetical protein